MIKFAYAQGVNICIRENQDGSTTVLARCTKGAQVPGDYTCWQVTDEAKMPNELAKISLQMLIVPAWQSQTALAFMADILQSPKHLLVSDTKAV